MKQNQNTNVEHYKLIIDNLSQQVAVYAKDQAVINTQLIIERQEKLELIKQNEMLIKEINDLKKSNVDNNTLDSNDSNVANDVDVDKEIKMLKEKNKNKAKTKAKNNKEGK